jgi:hypothetical protein
MGGISDHAIETAAPPLPEGRTDLGGGILCSESLFEPAPKGADDLRSQHLCRHRHGPV